MRGSPSASAWSAIFLFTDDADGFECNAVVRYLAHGAPDDLREGAECDLYEGPKRVAEGRILGAP